MDKELRIIDLIVSFLTGKLEPIQQKELDDWLEASEENRRFFLSLMDAEAFQTRKREWQETDVDRVFERIRRKKNRLVFRRWIVAASVFLAVGISGFWVRWSMQQSPSLSAISEEITVGQSKAKLTLAGGQQIILENRDTLIQEENIHIRVDREGVAAYVGGEVPEAGEEMYNRIETGRGGEYQLLLSDGTKVWLNAGTELHYPVEFSHEARRVILRGEAYFQVTRKDQSPFIVETSRSAVKVLGTEFCIRDYTGQPNRTTLVSGSVSVEDQAGATFIITPGQQLCLDREKSRVEEVETLYYTAWKDGYFIFHETPLEQIMEELAQWYDFHCFFENPGLAGRKLDARLKKYDNIGLVLDLLSQTGNIRFVQKGRLIVVQAVK